MEDIESLMRTAGIVVVLLMAVLLLRDAGRGLVGGLGALFSLGVSSYLVCSASGFRELSPFIHLPLLTLCVSNPVFFWLLSRALFDLGFGFIGPFNRAFKDATGMTPTEFRRAHLGGGAEGNNLAES